MKEYQTISLSYDDGIALLRLNRPDKMNALSTPRMAVIKTDLLMVILFLLGKYLDCLSY